MRIQIVLNPNAGSADEIEALRATLQRHLPEALIRETAHPGDAQRYAREALAAGAEVIVAAGGDGTLNEVVNGLADDFGRACLGLLPLGTGNDFARTINIPTDLEAACAILRANQRRSVDVVRVQSDRTRYFINVSAGGFTGLVDEKLTDEIKQSWGPLAYLRSAAEALPEMVAYEATISFDDQPPQHMRVYSVVVANARYAGGGIPVAPQAAIDDGLLDVLIVPAASLPALALVAAQILLGQHTDSDQVIMRRARRVAVASQPGMWFNADGELVGNQPATFEVVPRAVQVIVGPAQPT